MKRGPEGVKAGEKIKYCVPGIATKGKSIVQMFSIRYRMKNPNHPKKGSSIRVAPIRRQEDVANIKKLLQNEPRNLAIFILGIDTSLRASDILNVKVGQARHIKLGEHFCVREKKTGKDKCITMNQAVYATINSLLATMPEAKDSDYLFQSQRGDNQPLTVPALNGLVKSWCDWVGLTGNYGAQSLKKTFGYMHHKVFDVDIETLEIMSNHTSPRHTLIYGTQPEEVEEV